MSDYHLKTNLVETSCSIIMNTVKSLPLNYNITETPYSIYLTLRKSLLKNSEGLKVENKDEKIRKLELANSNLSASLEDAVNECEEHAKTISELKVTVKNLLDKLDTSEKKCSETFAQNTLKDAELEDNKTKNKTLVAEIKSQKKDFKELSKDFDLLKHESSQSKISFESKVELLEKRLKYQSSETADILKKTETDKAELKIFREKLVIERKESTSQTDSHPEVPYLVTDPLPPIFSSQLCYRSRPIHFLSRSLPKLNRILWCPPDDDYIDEAEEFLAEQYDREIRDFYLDAQEQARLRHEGQVDEQDQLGLEEALDENQHYQTDV